MRDGSAKATRSIGTCRSTTRTIYRFDFIYNRTRPIERERYEQENANEMSDNRYVRNKANRYLQDRGRRRQRTSPAWATSTRPTMLCHRNAWPNPRAPERASRRLRHLRRRGAAAIAERDRGGAGRSRARTTSCANRRRTTCRISWSSRRSCRPAAIITRCGKSADQAARRGGVDVVSWWCCHRETAKRSRRSREGVERWMLRCARNDAAFASYLASPRRRLAR